MRRVGGLVLVCFSMMATAAWAAPALVRQWSSTRKVVTTDASRAPRAARSVRSAQAPVLLGETAVQSAGTGGPAGRAEAFRFKDRRPGVARSVRLYVASANRATGLTAGLYSDRSGAPGRLLSTGSVVGSRRDAWETVVLSSVSIRSGRSYWIAVVGRRGTLALRDQRTGSCRGEVLGTRGASALPRRWRGTRRSSGCLVSAYVVGAPSAQVSSVATGGAHKTTSSTSSPTRKPGGGTSSGHGSGGTTTTTTTTSTTTSTTATTSTTTTTSSPTPSAPVNTAMPVISGSAVQGRALSASSGTWTGSPSYGYQWEDCAGSSCSSIAGATGSSYTLAASDVGDAVAVVVKATNAGGSVSATSAKTGTVTSSGQSGAALDGIQVAGNALQTASGQAVTLHGVDQSGTEYECTEGNGIFDNGASSLAASASDSTDLAVMPSWHINSVFIGLNEDCWLGINGSGINNWSADSGQNYINAIKNAVSAAESDGLYPVIGYYWGDPGTEVPTGNDPNGGGQPPLPDNDHAPLFWEEVADTFKNDPNVIFRLQEEPHPADVGTSLAAWQCWSQGDVQYSTSSDNAYGTAPTPASSTSHCSEKATNGTTAYSTVGMQSLVNVIRGTGATNVIQVPGLAYANMTACSSSGNPTTCGILDSTDGVKVTDPLSTSSEGSQLMVDLDMYPDAGQICDTTTCYNDTIAPVMAAMPVDLGEIGPVNGSQTGAMTLLNWMDSKSPQGSYYAWAWDTWSDLISSYSGTPDSPWGTDYKGLISAAAAPANQTSPTISGTLAQGATDTANDGTWTQGGIAGYQWMDCTSAIGGCAAISGATNGTYTPVGSDVGNYLEVSVTYSNSYGSGAATSAEYGPVQALAQPTDGITFDQVVASSNSSCDPTSASFTLNHVTAGDDLFLVADGAGYTSAASTLTGVSDSKDGAWTALESSGSQLGNVSSEYASYAVYEYSNAAAASTSSPMTVTVKSNWGQSGVSCVIIAVKGAASFTDAYNTTIQGASTTFTGPTLSSVPSGDVVMGLFGSYSHSSDVFSAPSGWNTSGTYWDVSQGAAAMDWTQTSSSGPQAASIMLNSNEIHYGMTVDLHP